MRLPAEDPPEFQRDAVELVLASGRSINSVGLSSVRGSRAARRATGPKRPVTPRNRDADPDGLCESERIAPQRPRREVLELRADRDILREAAPHSPARGCGGRFRFVDDHRLFGQATPGPDYHHATPTTPELSRCAATPALDTTRTRHGRRDATAAAPRTRPSHRPDNTPTIPSRRRPRPPAAGRSSVRSAP